MKPATETLPKAEIARIYQTSQRQIDRWIQSHAPVLVANRMKSYLLSQNNAGRTGALLQNEETAVEIQRELDKLFGEDLASSARVFERLVEIDDAIKLLTLHIAASDLTNKPALRKAAKQLSAAIRSLDDFNFIMASLPYSERPGATEEEEPEEVEG